VTQVACDASVRGQAAAWAAVIRREDGTEVRLRGPLPPACDSCGAELEAVWRALRATRRGERVEVVVDSRRVLGWLLDREIPPLRWWNRVDEVRRLLRRRQATVRWTPAHRAGEDAAHREADRLARRALRAVMPGAAAMAFAAGIGADAVSTAALLQRGWEGNPLLVALSAQVGALPAVVATHVAALAATGAAWWVSRRWPDLASPRRTAWMLGAAALLWWVAQAWNLLVLARIL
jgi:ribonuclease HI